MKDLIVKLLAAELTEHLEEDVIDRLVEIPPSPEMGDFAFPCFSLARIYRKSPVSIADELMKKFVHHESFEKITAVSGYLNFFMNPEKKLSC